MNRFDLSTAQCLQCGNRRSVTYEERDVLRCLYCWGPMVAADHTSFGKIYIDFRPKHGELYPEGPIMIGNNFESGTIKMQAGMRYVVERNWFGGDYAIETFEGSQLEARGNRHTTPSTPDPKE